MTVGGGLVEGYTDVRMPGVICESESIWQLICGEIQTSKDM